jgi:type IV secretory pathway VirB3-like protein
MLFYFHYLEVLYVYLTGILFLFIILILFVLLSYIIFREPKTKEPEMVFDKEDEKSSAP